MERPVEQPGDRRRSEALCAVPGEVDLWTVDPEAPASESVLAECRALLAADETERLGRFRFERHRREFLATRVLVRCVLSRYADVRPAGWRFTAGAEGKPAIEASQAPEGLRFNLANTAGLVVCGLTRESEIGVDVEDMRRRGETVKIANRFFSPAEASALRGLPEARQRERFFRYWTLKEAYIKGRGLGLKIPLDQFSFDLDESRSQEDPRIAIEFDGALGREDDAVRWAFWQARRAERHMLAVGIRSEAAAPALRLRLRPVSSLSELIALAAE